MLRAIPPQLEVTPSPSGVVTLLLAFGEDRDGRWGEHETPWIGTFITRAMVVADRDWLWSRPLTSPCRGRRRSADPVEDRVHHWRGVKIAAVVCRDMIVVLLTAPSSAKTKKRWSIVGGSRHTADDYH